MTTLEAVRAALARIVDPSTGRDILAADMVKALKVDDGAVSFVLEVDPARGRSLEPVRKAAEEAVAALEGVRRVTAVMTADLRASPASKKAPEPAKSLPGVEKIVAIASGKGGVGKSTLTANLAVALAARGQKVGLLDADVYGPSQPRMLGVGGRPSSPDGRIILPLRNHGVALMSLGLMADENEALAWRGPMLIGALQQMLRQVQWGALDVLLVDLPPGTGDVQMTLCQTTEVAGAVVVSTPQDIALIDARKAIDMFAKMNCPVLGLVENMSGFTCDRCGKRHELFGSGGAEAEARKLGAPFLGAIPLDLDIRLAGDGGAPIAIAKPESPQARAFFAIADALA